MHGVSKYENRPSERSYYRGSRLCGGGSRRPSPTTSVVAIAEPADGNGNQCHTFFHFARRTPSPPRTSSPRRNRLRILPPPSAPQKNRVTMPINTTSSAEMLQLFNNKNSDYQRRRICDIRVPCSRARCTTPSTARSNHRHRKKCSICVSSSTSAPSSGGAFSADDEDSDPNINPHQRHLNNNSNNKTLKPDMANNLQSSREKLEAGDAIGDPRSAHRQELMNKIRKTLADVTKTVVDISSKYMPLMEKVDFTTSRNIVVDEANGNSSMVKILKYDEHTDDGITSKRVLSRSLKNSLMILKKINEVSETFEPPPRVKFAPKKIESKSRPISRNYRNRPVVETKTLLRLKTLLKTPRSRDKTIRSRERTLRSRDNLRSRGWRDRQAAATKNESKVDQKYQVQVKTTGPINLDKRKSPRVEKSYLNLDNVTIDRLPPIKSEYPRRDHLTHTSVENTFLFKLVNSMEPKITCSDGTCGSCKRSLMEKSDDPDSNSDVRTPLNCDMGSRRGGKSFNFKKYMSDLRMRHSAGVGPGQPFRQRVLQAFPVNVFKANPPLLPPPHQASKANLSTKPQSKAKSRGPSQGTNSVTRKPTTRHLTQEPTPNGRVVKKCWTPRSSNRTTRRTDAVKTPITRRRNDVVIGGPRTRNKAEQIFNRNYGALPLSDAERSTEQVPKSESKIGSGSHLGTQNRLKLHKYIEAIEDKFLKTFSLPEKEKAAAYKTLELEIKKMLDILSGAGVGRDVQIGIANSLERITNSGSSSGSNNIPADTNSAHVFEELRLKKKCVAKSQPTICRDSISFINSLQKILSKQSMHNNMAMDGHNNNNRTYDTTGGPMNLKKHYTKRHPEENEDDPTSLR